MSFIVKEKEREKREFKKAPEGTLMAVCNAIVDLGLQSNRFDNKIQRKVWIRWELPHEEKVTYKDKNGVEHTAPLSVHATYTVSFFEKSNLYKALTAWRGKPFTKQELANGVDLFQFLNTGCQVVVEHSEPNENGDYYANVKGVVGWPKGVPQIRAETPLLRYSEEEPGAFSDLPEWIQKKIEERVREPVRDGEPLPDDVPF